MQLKLDLISLSQRLIPGPLARAFGIATDDDKHANTPKDALQRSSSCKAGCQQLKASPSRKRPLPDDAAAEEPVVVVQATATAVAPPATVVQPANAAASMQQDSAVDAAACAAASMQAASAMAQAAASMQTTSGLSAGYQHPHAAASAGTAGAGVMNPFRGFPAAAYRFSPQTLLPYMGAAPQAMAMSNLTGSLGCAPMSMYSGGPSDFGQMVRAQEEDAADDSQARALKRPRLVWTPQLHKLFEEAVNKLGLDKAVPKTIMQIMNVEGLTRENVASHLQKYRLSLKKTTDGDGSSKAAADGAEGGSAELRDKDATGSAAAGAIGSGSGGGTNSSQRGGTGGSSSSSGADGSGSSSGRRGYGGDAEGGSDEAAADVDMTAAADTTAGGQAHQQQQQQQQQQQPPP